MFNLGERRNRRRHKPSAATSSAAVVAEREKERERFYLLPGMGGRAYRQKQNFILKVSLSVGLLASVALAVMIYFLNHPRR